MPITNPAYACTECGEMQPGVDLYGPHNKKVCTECIYKFYKQWKPLIDEADAAIKKEKRHGKKKD